MKTIGARQWLRTESPDFMFCTVHELFLMYEQINWDIEWHSFRKNFTQ